MRRFVPSSLQPLRRAGAVLLVTLGAIGCVLARPARREVGPPPIALGAETVAYPSASGSQIHAWLARGRRGGGSVLLLHGVGANRKSMLGRARFLHDWGFTVLAPDFQAHGESPGEHITFGARESLDAAASIAFLRGAMPGERIGVIGVSMGGAAALLGPGPLTADAFVLESVYPTIRHAVSDRLATWFGPLGGAGRRFAPAVIHFVGGAIGVAEAELQPIDRIAKLGAPLLLITGSADRYTPVAEAESLFARAGQPKTFWNIDGAGHEDLHAYVRAEYERRVGAFLALELRSLALDSAGRAPIQF